MLKIVRTKQKKNKIHLKLKLFSECVQEKVQSGVSVTERRL